MEPSTVTGVTRVAGMRTPAWGEGRAGLKCQHVTDSAVLVRIGLHLDSAQTRLLTDELVACKNTLLPRN